MEEQLCSCGLKKKATRMFTFNDGDYYCCESDECKIKLQNELEDLYDRDVYFQGKRPSSYASSAKITFWAILAFGLIALGQFFVSLITALF